MKNILIIIILIISSNAHASLGKCVGEVINVREDKDQKITFVEVQFKVNESLHDKPISFGYMETATNKQIEDDVEDRINQYCSHFLQNMPNNNKLVDAAKEAIVKKKRNHNLTSLKGRLEGKKKIKEDIQFDFRGNKVNIDKNGGTTIEVPNNSN